MYKVLFTSNICEGIFEKVIFADNEKDVPSIAKEEIYELKEIISITKIL